jgi:hypothetical protein
MEICPMNDTTAVLANQQQVAQAIPSPPASSGFALSSIPWWVWALGLGAFLYWENRK